MAAHTEMGMRLAELPTELMGQASLYSHRSEGLKASCWLNGGDQTGGPSAYARPLEVQHC